MLGCTAAILTIDQALDSALANGDPWSTGSSMPQPLYKPAVCEASARYISVKAVCRVEQLGLLTIFENTVPKYLQDCKTVLSINRLCILMTYTGAVLILQ